MTTASADQPRILNRGTRLARLVAVSLTPAGLRAGIRRAEATWLDERFERTSPIPAMPGDLLDAVSGQEVTLPPRRMLMQPGNQTTDGLLFLISLARTISAETVFEIGTYNGLTTWCLARNLPSATVHTLDLPVDQIPALALEPSDHRNRVEFEERIYESLKSSGHVTQHWGDSATFDFSNWRGCCDLVYVDGAHSKEYVEADTRNAMEMISEHGVIVWDDYWRHVSGVRSVLDSRTELGLYRVPGTRLVVHLSSGALQRIRENA